MLLLRLMLRRGWVFWQGVSRRRSVVRAAAQVSRRGSVCRAAALTWVVAAWAGLQDDIRIENVADVFEYVWVKTKIYWSKMAGQGQQPHSVSALALPTMRGSHRGGGSVAASWT